MDWYIGCSGFHYKHWRERFYPKGLAVKHWFEFYSSRFNTLELNVTHYRFPTEKALDDWYHNSPNDFLFAVKMYKGITHYKKLHDCKRMVDDFYGLVAAGLKEKAGCVLFQFPQSFHFNETNINRILDNVNPHFQNAVEFRHESWWNEEGFAAFAKKKIAFCGVSHPQLPSEVIATAPTIYYRLHGDTRLYSSNYSREKLISVQNAIKQSKDAKAAFVYFNNDFNAYAVKNALELKELI